MAFICKTPGCGEDVTAEVLRKLASTGIAMRTKDRKADPVVVKCSKGHQHLYP
jgi:hypothetical protein